MIKGTRNKVGLALSGSSDDAWSRPPVVRWQHQDCSNCLGTQHYPIGPFVNSEDVKHGACDTYTTRKRRLPAFWIATRVAVWPAVIG
jgi:hypothetical protein